MRLKRWHRLLLPPLTLLAVLATLEALGLGLPLLIGAALVGIVITGLVPSYGVRALDRALSAWRAWNWRGEQGHHHAFGGLALHIEDDGRHAWVLGEDLQAVLRTRDPDAALAARHSARWRHDAQGRLWLRVDAVVERLATMPGRTDPRHLRLRRYLERDVLFPAAERRRRSRQAD